MIPAGVRDTYNKQSRGRRECENFRKSLAADFASFEIVWEKLRFYTRRIEEVGGNILDIILVQYAMSLMDTR